MQHPEPALGAAQIHILKTLKAASGTYVALKEERALEKLFKKGYIRWQQGIKGKEYMITKQGLEALDRRES